VCLKELFRGGWQLATPGIAAKGRDKEILDHLFPSRPIIIWERVLMGG